MTGVLDYLMEGMCHQPSEGADVVSLVQQSGHMQTLNWSLNLMTPEILISKQIQRKPNDHERKEV